MKRGSTEYQRLCVLARIDNTRRSSRAETNPSSYGISIDTFRSSATSGFLGTSLAAGSSRGSQPPETWKPGTGKIGRGTPRRAAMNFVGYARARIIETFFHAFYITRLGLLHSENIAGIFGTTTGFSMQRVCRQ